MHRAILHPGVFQTLYQSPHYTWNNESIHLSSSYSFLTYHFACIIKVWGVKKCQTGCLELIPVVHCFVFLHQPQGWNKLIVISSLKSKTCCGTRLPQKEGLLIHVGHLGYYLLRKDRKRTLKGRTLVKMLPSFVVGTVVTTVSSSHWL